MQTIFSYIVLKCCKSTTAHATNLIYVISGHFFLYFDLFLGYIFTIINFFKFLMLSIIGFSRLSITVLIQLAS